MSCSFIGCLSNAIELDTGLDLWELLLDAPNELLAMYNADELFTNSDRLSLYMDFGNNDKLRVFTDAPISVATLAATVVAATLFSPSIGAMLVAATPPLARSRSIFVATVGIGLESCAPATVGADISVVADVAASMNSVVKGIDVEMVVEDAVILSVFLGLSAVLFGNADSANVATGIVSKALRTVTVMGVVFSIAAVDLIVVVAAFVVDDMVDISIVTVFPSRGQLVGILFGLIEDVRLIARSITIGGVITAKELALCPIATV